MRNLSNTRPQELIEELSPSILRYPDEFGTEQGKFIRIGSLVLVAPSAKEPAALKALHAVMLSVATRRDTELAAKVAEEAQASWDAGLPRLKDRERNIPSIVEDGGLFGIGRQDDVFVYSSSGTFGRAEERGRLFTAELFHQVLGEATSIKTKLY